MAWPELARLLLRPEARRPETWRRRWAFGALFAATGLWAAIAPQINFSLGERLRLAFQIITPLATAVALLSGLRYTPRADCSKLADSVVLYIRGANDLIGVAPIFLLLLGLEAVSPFEVILAGVMICLALMVSTLVASMKGPTLLVPILVAALFAMRRRSGFEAALISTYAAHLYFKARTSFAISRATRSPNVAFEIVTSLTPVELCGLRQRLRFFRAALLGLAALNLSILLLANYWPIKLEEKLPLALVLAFGIASLFLDTFTLRWRVMFGNPFSTLGIVLGIPWAVAWAFAALHTGEAFTMNEGAAYFFVWIALGLTLSWMVGNAAKQKALRDFRELAASPSPSLSPYPY